MKWNDRQEIDHQNYKVLSKLMVVALLLNDNNAPKSPKMQKKNILGGG